MNLLVNPTANSGKSQALVRNLILQGSVGRQRIQSICYDYGDQAVEKWCLEQLERGEGFFVAAGGDGTLNYLLNRLMSIALVRPEFADKIELGAIGLGSSNDAHKPIDGRQSRPFLKVDRRCLKRIDIGKLESRLGDKKEERYFLLNSSVGLTSEANDLFNSSSTWWLRVCKKVSTELAIHVTALVTLLKNRKQPLVIEIGSQQGDYLVNNLSIFKRRHFAGSFKFNEEPQVDDGLFHIKVHHSMGRAQLLRAAVGLLTGRFKEGEKSFSGVERTVVARTEGSRPFRVEIDGEVLRAHYARWTVVDRAIHFVE